MQPRYIVENGRVKLNPLYESPVSEDKKENTLANPARALVYPYNIYDANAAAETTEGKLSQSTQQVIETVQSKGYTEQFGAGERIDGGNLLETVSNVFTNIQAPIGLSKKLIALEGYALHIKIDDSGSMSLRCNNNLTRWQNVQNRLLQFMNLIQVVPTRTITISFLDRKNVITLDRNKKTPEEFVIDATQRINEAFRVWPSGSTPIHRNVKSMLSMARGKTAHYLFTDGEPNEYEPETEIQYIKNLLLGRRDPQNNPFTFLCCSDIPTDTLWMHEIEEIACQPSAPGYVAAIQNFRAEQLEVLNDQGPEFPYSESVWMLCNLTAALHPNDLDALDQHAPLTKPILDDIMGRECTLTEYESYFNQHPNANWLFGEDYDLFLTTAVTSQIPSVAYFEQVLAQELNRDINNRNDTSEARAIERAEEAIIQRFSRNRPENIRRARQDFWHNHYIRMETMQAQHVGNSAQQAQQDLWGDYVAASNLGQLWQGYVEQFKRPRPVAAAQVDTGQQLSSLAPVQQAPTSSEAPPPPYSSTSDEAPPPPYSSASDEGSTTVVAQQPVYYQYSAPQYYQGYIQPAAYTQSTVDYSQTTPSWSNYQRPSEYYNPGLWQQPQPQVQALQAQAPEEVQQQGNSPSCCSLI